MCEDDVLRCECGYETAYSSPTATMMDGSCPDCGRALETGNTGVDRGDGPRTDGGTDANGVERRVPDSHPDAETIAYCPRCEAELSDFHLGTGTDGNTPPGRCRECGGPAWLSAAAASLINSDFVAYGMFVSKVVESEEDGKQTTEGER